MCERLVRASSGMHDCCLKTMLNAPTLARWSSPRRKVQEEMVRKGILRHLAQLYGKLLTPGVSSHYQDMLPLLRLCTTAIGTLPLTREDAGEGRRGATGCACWTVTLTAPARLLHRVAPTPLLHHHHPSHTTPTLTPPCHPPQTASWLPGTE